MSESDPLLASYLAASSAEESEQLAQLLREHADPLIEAILRGRQNRAGGSTDSFADAEDAASAVRERLIRQLSALREEAREPIRDFRAYVARMTYSAWAENLRARHPQRALFLNRLRYVLENHTPQKGFALWEDADGAKWCGLRSWAGGPTGPSPKLQWLLVDPEAAARAAVGGVAPRQLALPDLLARLFKWLGGPIELRDLTASLSELLGISRTPTIAAVGDDVAVDPRFSPVEDAVWKEYLSWLWREIGALSARQRQAFLLHSDVLREFELLGVASIRAIAPQLELEPNELAELWNRLPLDDLTTAKMLGCTRQQVINLRRVARTKLGEAWREWNLGAGNKPAASPSR